MFQGKRVNFPLSMIHKVLWSRNDYLLNNDKYLVKLLREIRDCVPDLPWEKEKYKVFGGLLNKHGSSIEIWMEVNIGWRSRCTAEKLEKHKKWKTRDLRNDLDTDLIFNNPAVAIELGLLDVLRHMVEEMSISLTKLLWTGFSNVRTGFCNVRTLTFLALERAKASILSYILSSDSFGWRDDTSLGNLLFEATLLDSFEAECFEIFIAHPKVDANVDVALRDNSLFLAVRRLVYDRSYCVSKSSDAGIGDGEKKQCRLKKVHVLLDAGANPRWIRRTGALSAIDMAKKAVNDYPGEGDMWRNILQKMEAYGEGV